MALVGNNKPPSFSLHFMAGGIGGTVGAAILCPLEVAKTRLQSSLYNSSRKTPPPGMAQNPFRLIAFHMGDVISILRCVFASPCCLAYIAISYDMHSIPFEHGILTPSNRDIAQREGIPALWKGLGPNLVGVVPARYSLSISILCRIQMHSNRAIYFASYSQGKHVYAKLNSDQKETPGVHMLSAASAGTVTALFTNPIWVAKTRVVRIIVFMLKGSAQAYIH